MNSLSLLQGIFPTKGSNPGLPHCREILYQLSHRESLFTQCNGTMQKKNKNFCGVCDTFYLACKLSHFSRVWLFVTLWTVACQPPLSMGFSRQECWSGWPSPGDLSDPGIELRSPALQADSLPTELWGKPCFTLCAFKIFLVIATVIEHVSTWIWWQVLNVLHWKYKTGF